MRLGGSSPWPGSGCEGDSVRWSMPGALQWSGTPGAEAPAAPASGSRVGSFRSIRDLPENQGVGDANGTRREHPRTKRRTGRARWNLSPNS